MMKKIAIVLAGLLALSGCATAPDGPAGRLDELASEDARIEARCEALVNAVDAGDGEALKDMFSAKAKAEEVDWDAGTQDLLSAYQGALESWEMDHYSTEDSMDDGVYTSWAEGIAVVTTDEGGYWLFWEMDAANSEDPDGVGFNWIALVPEERVDKKHAWNAIKDRESSYGIEVMSEG